MAGNLSPLAGMGRVRRVSARTRPHATLRTVAALAVASAWSTLRRSTDGERTTVSFLSPPHPGLAHPLNFADHWPSPQPASQRSEILGVHINLAKARLTRQHLAQLQAFCKASPPRPLGPQQRASNGPATGQQWPKQQVGNGGS